VQLVNVPEPLVDSVIVPDGVSAGDGDVSVTVTVQLTGALTTVVAAQLIAMVLVLRVEVTVPLVPLLVECTLSP
jgi:hypothetical protein